MSLHKLNKHENKVQSKHKGHNCMSSLEMNAVLVTLFI